MEGESIRTFAARCRGQARACAFTMPCKAAGCAQENDQGDLRAADTIVAGLRDLDIRAEVLKDPNDDMTIKELIQFIERRVVGRTTHQAYGDHTSGQAEVAAVSAFKKPGRSPLSSQPP